jgi:hypothetical protein
LSERRERKLKTHRRNANESLVEKTNRRRGRNKTLQGQRKRSNVEEREGGLICKNGTHLVQ